MGLPAPQPFEAPRADGPPPDPWVLRAALWPGAFLAVIFALDVGGLWVAWLGVGALVFRVAVMVGGLTSCVLAGGYALVQGWRSRSAAELLVGGLGFVAVSVASWVPLVLANP